ncbi:MAG: transcription-repair coupling factor [Clostridia bacterium]|nr:transcription-repair coupling factor [Clostridia bacterium]
MQLRYNIFSDALGKTDSFKELSAAVKNRLYPIALTGVSHIHRCVLSAVLAAQNGQKALVLTAGDAENERVLEDLEALGLNVAVFPARDYCFRRNVSHSHEYEHKRIGTLSKVLEGAFDVCVASIEAAVSTTVPPEALRDRCFTLSVGEECSMLVLAEKLIAGGYVKSAQVDGAGQFSIRGSIVDIFSPNLPNPCRLDFFGDEIDSIALFDVDTQRRTDTLDEIKITPVTEGSPDDPEQLAESLGKLLKKKSISEAQRKRIQEDIDRLEVGAVISYDAYLRHIFDRNVTLFDYFCGRDFDSITFIYDTNACFDKVDSCLKLHSEEIKTLLLEGELPPDFKSVYLDRVGLAECLKKADTVYCDSFPKTSYDVPPKALVNLNFKQNSGFSGAVASLCEDIKSSAAKLTVVLGGSERAASNLCEEMCELGLKANFCLEPSQVGKKGIFVTVGVLSSGFELPDGTLSVIVHGKTAVKKRKKRFSGGSAVGSLEELQRGDYVVHATHGIGIFEGVQQLTTRGMTRDYIKISYAGKDALYVPVTSLDMVSRYIGSAEDTAIKLNKLGSSDWSRTRSRVKKAVKDMAKQLTVLYAKRMQQKGYQFSPDGDLQSDFERRFEFDETDDQLRCISEIKRDMERGVPMDRLLCGDVGFGKTEVALRAAFKCIADGKQCAILVPTTILCWQHYNTALQRFGNMAVEVEMLSRFRTPKQQEKIRKNLLAGNIDLIVGTHALISKDVKFKDLGLIIIDEEQRFGVAQKERLKELYPTVDALTLSATPIPRTLNMALSGLRDMSSIEEAPMNRHPVQTYVMEQDRSVVNEAISRELRRGGQVYYLHNRTEDIDSCAMKLQQAHPEARIGTAHGKMSEDTLSRVWQQLLEHEIDILVCTTIIETGVDVPNANTLIIENSDRFGLAQLHQLRGRVGRSHRTAFAYLLFTPGKALSDISQKRLDAIRRFTEFGSGFRIAMRDLEIRGAGSVLGGEQHGHMEAVGYDMYLKLLSEALAEEKGEEPEKQLECVVDIKMSAHIPERYISSLPQRLSAYRRIAAIRTNEDVLDVTDELLDRYGDLPQVVNDLIQVSFLKNKAAEMGITEISDQNGRLLLYCGALTESISRLLTSNIKRRVMFSAGSKPYVSVRLEEKQHILDALKEALGYMEQ